MARKHSNAASLLEQCRPMFQRDAALVNGLAYEIRAHGMFMGGPDLSDVMAAHILAARIAAGHIPKD
jgi:ribulose-5-phosphate 4-epimerase/fuculose-1-phosphate aldolase